MPVTVPHHAVDNDLSQANTSPAQIAELIGCDKRVLAMGGWSGDDDVLARANGCVVDGFEVDDKTAAAAGLDHTPLSDHSGAASYDVVVLADVVERVADPVAVLRDAAGLLREDGFLVISAPNVTHGSVRLALLQGSWATAETGILDRSHTRFLSRRGLIELIEQAGLVVDELRGTLADPLEGEVRVDPDRLPPDAIEWVRDQEDAFIYQFQLRARVRTSADQVSSYDLHAPARLVDVRPIDEHTERRMRAKRDELIRRDHVLGLQAEATTARLRAERATGKAALLRGRVSRLRRRLRRQERAIAELEEQINELRYQLIVANSGWAGLARSAYRRIRRR